MLPLWFVLALRLVVRKQNGVQEFDARRWTKELDDLYQFLPEGATWLQRWLVNELKLWILTERLRVQRLDDAGVKIIGKLPR
jgi:hypothetical protein